MLSYLPFYVRRRPSESIILTFFISFATTLIVFHLFSFSWSCYVSLCYS